jgi:hypothetical protein
VYEEDLQGQRSSSHHQVGQEIARRYQELGVEGVGDRRHKTPALTSPQPKLNFVRIVLPHLT